MKFLKSKNVLAFIGVCVCVGAYFLFCSAGEKVILEKNNKNQNWFETNLKADALYKIVVSGDYDKNQEEDCIKPSQLDLQSGFIHASYGRQSQATVEKFFKDAPKVLLIELDKNVLQQEGFDVKDEQNKPGGTFYPHIYKVKHLPQKAIRMVLEYTR